MHLVLGLIAAPAAIARPRPAAAAVLFAVRSLGFVGDGARVEGHPVQAIEGSSHALVLGRVRKEVARQLLG